LELRATAKKHGALLCCGTQLVLDAGRTTQVFLVAFRLMFGDGGFGRWPGVASRVYVRVSRRLYKKLKRGIIQIFFVWLFPTWCLSMVWKRSLKEVFHPSMFGGVF